MGQEDDDPVKISFSQPNLNSTQPSMAGSAQASVASSTHPSRSGSMSVSTNTEEMNDHNRFKVSSVLHAYDNPLIQALLEVGDVDQVSDQLPDIARKLSAISMAYQQRGGGRKVSRDMGIQVTTTSILPELFPSMIYDDVQWSQLTYDAVPRVEHYRLSTTLNKHSLRPTLEELRNPKHDRQSSTVRKFSILEKGETSNQAVKFGWIRGVYIRCLLNIWGVMLFLRMGWMVGQAGIGFSILIVLLATVITIVTTLSMAAICTNGEVRGGGVYYMISRSLGPEFGGAIGMIFFVANSVAVSMYIIGAAETVWELLFRYDAWLFDDGTAGLNHIRLAGVCLLVLVMCVTGIGMAFENKAQLVLLVLLLAAMVDYLVGGCLTPNPDQFVKGFVGWNVEVAKTNFGPGFRPGEDFFSVFSIFFPSVIGILAGANISGDLKNPSTAIPKGTILAILTTSFSYIVIIIWLGCTLLRDASGDTGLANATVADLGNCTGACKYGMINYDPVMEMSSAFGPLIFVGIFAATLSSALAALVSAPRIFQALCKDQIFPALKIFAKGYGPNDDPRRASLIVFAIALGCTLIGNLNAIAPVISNFFMGSYCLINFSCFHASFVKSPGFRPGFRYYNEWLSLVGSLVCLTVMFIMSWVTALVTLAIVLGLYIYIHRKQPAVNWGSSTQGYVYKNALSAVTKLSNVEDHVKNYRPAILVLTGNTSSRPPLVDFAHTITKKLGLMVCGHIVKNNPSQALHSAIEDHNRSWLENRKIKAFYSLFQANSLTEGTRAELQLVGLGKLRPNMLLMGFKSNWQKSGPRDMDDYFNIIHMAFDLHLSVAILRVRDGLDYVHHFETDTGVPYSDVPNSIPKKESKKIEETLPIKIVKKPPLKSDDSSDSESEPSANGQAETGLDLDVMPSRKLSRVVPDVNAKLAKFRRVSTVEPAELGIEEIPAKVLDACNIFQIKQRGTIDVWWLYDDGGLTMLIPYLLTTRSLWGSCSLRVFVTAHKNALDETQINIAALLKKFRIDYSQVTVITDINSAPQEESKQKFQKMVSNWLTEIENPKNTCGISKADLLANQERTNRNIRLRELLEVHSKNAALIIMTLPMPRKKSCPATLYMSWLDTLTNDMPPFLLIRGNQTSVLTFYS